MMVSTKNGHGEASIDGPFEKAAKKERLSWLVNQSVTFDMAQFLRKFAAFPGTMRHNQHQYVHASISLRVLDHTLE